MRTSALVGLRGSGVRDSTTAGAPRDIQTWPFKATMGQLLHNLTFQPPRMVKRNLWKENSNDHLDYMLRNQNVDDVFCWLKKDDHCKQQVKRFKAVIQYNLYTKNCMWLYMNLDLMLFKRYLGN